MLPFSQGDFAVRALSSQMISTTCTTIGSSAACLASITVAPSC